MTGGIQKGDSWNPNGTFLFMGSAVCKPWSCMGSLSSSMAPYASEMAALIVIMTPAAAALVDRSVTSDIPRDHCIGHVLYLPVLPRWCKLLSSFTASIILLPQQLPPLREGRSTHFLVYLPYINWH